MTTHNIHNTNYTLQHTHVNCNIQNTNSTLHIAHYKMQHAVCITKYNIYYAIQIANYILHTTIYKRQYTNYNAHTANYIIRTTHYTLHTT